MDSNPPMAPVIAEVAFPELGLRVTGSDALPSNHLVGLFVNSPSRHHFGPGRPGRLCAAAFVTYYRRMG